MQTIKNIAMKYLRDNPITEPSYIISESDGVKRNRDYRYDLRPEDQLTDIGNFHYVAARATLLRKERGETSFYVNPVGPVKIYLNNELVYESIRLEETEPSTGRRFTVQTELCNEIIILMKKTNIGIGAIFGTGSVKGDPFFVFSDVEEKIEGWKFSKPFDELGKLREISWQESENIAETLPSNFFEWRMGESLYAKALLDVKQRGIYHLEGLRHETKVFVDEIEVLQRHIELEAGIHQIILQIFDKNERLEGLKLVNNNGTQLSFFSAFGFKKTWAYLGPINDKETVQITSILKNNQLVQNTFWQLSPTLHIRPVMDTPLYGQWNYPLGVTLNGLFNYSQYSNDKEILDYVHSHLSFCVDFYDYSIWDKQHFGAPSLNHCISMIDSLDDCGSMAYTLLRVHAVREIKGYEKLIKDVADYIMFQQHRLTDKTFYRDVSHSELMVKTLWADDVYMSLPFLTEYYLLTGYDSILNEIHRQFKQYFHYLYIPNKQMLSHVYSFKNQRGTEVCWGRGNAWVFLSLSLALERLSGTTIYPSLVELFNKVAPSYAKARGEDFFWHQVLDDSSSYAETSCTAIMLFSFAKDMKYCWTEESLISRADLMQTWQQLLESMVDEQYNLYGVCRGSAYSFDPDYYKYDLLPRTNDTHGIGIVLTAGCELMTLLEKEKLQIE